MAGTPKLPANTGPQQAFLELARKEVEGSPLKLSKVASMSDAPLIEAAFDSQLPRCLESLRDQDKCEVNVDLGGDKMKVVIDPHQVAIERKGEINDKTTIKLSEATRNALKI